MRAGWVSWVGMVGAVVWGMTDIELARASATAGGMRVGGGKGYRVVTYRALPKGGYSGTWYAMSKSLKAARASVAETRSFGLMAEVWYNGQPIV